MAGLLTPAALSLGALAGLILALHLLRPRLTERRLPSLLLWREIRRKPPAARPWQPLRLSLLLLLQLAALATLVLALARPWLRDEGSVGGRQVFILIDRSLAMAATDLAPNRLEAAKRRVRALVRERPEARFTLIAFDAHAEILAAVERDGAVLERALAALAIRPLPGDAAEALALAAALAEGLPDSQALLLTGGDVAISGASLPADLPLKVEVLGRATENQAITALSLGAGQSGPRLFVEAANAGNRPARRRLLVEGDGALLDARDLDLAPGGRASFQLDLPPAAQFSARFADADALPLDDRSWLLAEGQRGLDLALYGAANRFLEAALLLLPTVRSLRETADFAPGGALPDLAILNAALPSTLPPRPLLLIAPPAELGEGAEAIRPVGEDLELPLAALDDPAHPLLADGGLAEAAFLSAKAYQLGSAWRPLVSARSGGRTWPLLAEGTVGGQPALLLAFDLRDTDLPLLPAFPLLVAGAVEILAPRRLVEAPAGAAAGEALALRLAPGVTGLKVLDPAGRRWSPPIRGSEALLAESDLPGIYRVEAMGPRGTESSSFALNLRQSRPADIQPRDPLAMASTAGAAVDGAGSTTNPDSAPASSPGRRDLWQTLAWLALFLLLLEAAEDRRPGFWRGWDPRRRAARQGRS